MKTRPIALAVHGGAGPDSNYIRTHQKLHEEGLMEALSAGYTILEANGSSIDAVTAAVEALENNEVFNAGRGSALTYTGRVEMDAAIMEGKGLKAGAAALVTIVKNPIKLAKAIMHHTEHVLLAGKAADEIGVYLGLDTESQSYFLTPHREAELRAELKTEQYSSLEDRLHMRTRGTVGAVAVDSSGNVAAGTSTGGISGKLDGRVGDSCIIGAGCYADNNTCAVSATGDGELLIRLSLAQRISLMTALSDQSLGKVCTRVIGSYDRIEGDIGVISVNVKGEIAIAYNSERMHRAWIDTSGTVHCYVY